MWWRRWRNNRQREYCCAHIITDTEIVTGFILTPFKLLTWQAAHVHFFQVFGLQDDHGQLARSGNVSEREADITQLLLLLASTDRDSLHTFYVRIPCFSNGVDSLIINTNHSEFMWDVTGSEYDIKPLDRIPNFYRMITKTELLHRNVFSRCIVDKRDYKETIQMNKTQSCHFPLQYSRHVYACLFQLLTSRRNEIGCSEASVHLHQKLMYRTLTELLNNAQLNSARMKL